MEANKKTEAGFVMPWDIARANCPYSDVECIKTNEAEVVAVSIIQNDLITSLSFNLVLIESTDIKDSSQVSVFVRYDANVNLVNLK